MKSLHWIALALVVVGAINWGLVGLFQFDLVAALFGDASLLARLVYILVGASALWQIWPLATALAPPAAVGSASR